jgi:hypothetical protein
VFTATPGSEDAERLALLRVIGNERFASLEEVASGTDQITAP